MHLLLDHINIGLIVVACVNFLLGLAIILNGKQKINLSYSIITLTIIAWTISMILYRSAPGELSLVYGTVLYVSASFIASTFLYFTYIFPSERDTHIITKTTLIFLANAFLIILIIWPGLMIQAVNIRPGLEKEILFTNWYWFYFLYILGFFSFGYWRLIQKYKKSFGIERQQIIYVFLGYWITGNLAFITNLVMPWIGYFSLNWLGQFCTIIIVSCTTYAIIKHYLFSIKVVVTEVLVFLLSLVTLLQVFQSKSSSEVVFNLTIFLLVIGVGLFLIKSVIKEIKLREELEIANEGQANLIHIMNHQIKGYIAKSRNIFAELLTDESYGPISNETKPMLQAGLDTLTEGVNFVEGVLNSSSAEKGTLIYNMQPLDFKDLVTRTAEHEKKAAEDKGLTFETQLGEGDYKTRGDAAQLKEAVRNLIGNSIIYTPTGSVKVHVSRKDNTILMTVKDTGVGLSEEDKPRLFTKGGRGKDSLKVNINSTGYGLSFVKAVVEAHKGRVWAESEGPGKGSTFSMELPVV